MNHRKREHIEICRPCINFSKGECRFNDACWFKHENNSEKQNGCKYGQNCENRLNIPVCPYTHELQQVFRDFLPKETLP